MGCLWRRICFIPLRSESSLFGFCVLESIMFCCFVAWNEILYALLNSPGGREASAANWINLFFKLRQSLCHSFKVMEAVVCGTSSGSTSTNSNYQLASYRRLPHPMVASEASWWQFEAYRDSVPPIYRRKESNDFRRGRFSYRWISKTPFLSVRAMPQTTTPPSHLKWELYKRKV